MTYHYDFTDWTTKLTTDDALPREALDVAEQLLGSELKKSKPRAEENADAGTKTMTYSSDDTNFVLTYKGKHLLSIAADHMEAAGE